jgi:hypothetical protein
MKIASELWEDVVARNHRALRQHVKSLLTWNSPHLAFEETLANLPERLRGRTPRGAAHSPWEVLEHLRITQRDLIESCWDAKHVSPDFPAGYWPKGSYPPGDEAWEKSLATFRDDLREWTRIVEDEAVDLTAEIPGAGGRTVLRQALMSADHTSYHLGELLLLRRLLGAWAG